MHRWQLLYGIQEFLQLIHILYEAVISTHLKMNTINMIGKICHVTMGALMLLKSTRGEMPNPFENNENASIMFPGT